MYLFQEVDDEGGAISDQKESSYITRHFSIRLRAFFDVCTGNLPSLVSDVADYGYEDEHRRMLSHACTDGAVVRCSGTRRQGGRMKGRRALDNSFVSSIESNYDSIASFD